MSVLERCPSYNESNKGNKQRQGPTLSVRFTEVSVKRESTVLRHCETVKYMYLQLMFVPAWGNCYILYCWNYGQCVGLHSILWQTVSLQPYSFCYVMIADIVVKECCKRD